MKLFVGNLPYGVGDDELDQAFSAYGKVVSAKVITDRESGRSRGFGFVEMESSSEGSASIEGLNGSDLGGRAIVVNEAHDKAGR